MGKKINKKLNNGGIKMRKRKDNKKRWIILVLVLLLLIGGGVAYKVINKESTGSRLETEGEMWTGKKQSQGLAEPESIAIPGYETITLKSDTTEQSVNLYNPETNKCYFKMSILLPDGTKIWESKLVEPGKGLYEITLDEEVTAGEYENAVLKYECFTLDENQYALNGSEIKLKLVVI